MKEEISLPVPLVDVPQDRPIELEPQLLGCNALVRRVIGVVDCVRDRILEPIERQLGRNPRKDPLAFAYEV